MSLPEEYFLPDQEFTNLIMEDYKGKLNIYFAVTCSGENLRGFEPYLKMEALAKRLVPRRGEEVDIQKSDSLLNNVFRYRSLFDPSVYKDENARRLISNYAAAYLYLGLAYKRQGDLDRAIEAFETVDRFQQNRLLSSCEFTFPSIQTHLLRAISTNPSVSLWYKLGKVYLVQAKGEEAQRFILT